MKLSKETFLGALAGLLVVAGIVYYFYAPKELGGVKIPKPLNFNVQQYLTLDTSKFEEGQKKQYDSAVELLNKNKDDKEGLLAISSVYFSLDRNQEAETILDYTFNLYPTDIIILQNLASVLNGEKRFADEAEIYYKILDMNPLWLNAFDNLSSLYRFELIPRSDRFVEAIQHARDVDYNDEHESDLLRTLAFYYQYSGNKELAKEYFGLYLQRHPEDKDIQQLYKDLGGLPQGTIKFQ